MSYTAIITRITVTPHPNADRLALGTVLGNTVVVSKETTTGDVGIYFPPDGQLSEAFTTAHDLVARTDANGNRAGGFFDEKRRVRAQRFRGVKSEGFWMSVNALAFTGGNVADLQVGDELCAFNGVELCQKYVTEATRRAMRGQQRSTKRGESRWFKKHFDTTQFRFVKDVIFTNGGTVIITEKLHGTSQRTGYVLDEQPLPRWKQVVNHLAGRALFAPQRAYTLLHGTRNVVLDDAKPGFYGTNDFRRAVAAPWEALLHKGETVYYEVVGDLAPGTPIMGSSAVPADLKEVRTQYGPTMHWRYGCGDGVAAAYIYRITMTNEDGVTTELAWHQVQQRAAQLGVLTVPTLWVGQVDADTAARVELYADGASTLDVTHIREGVVVRVESPVGTTWAKHKSFAFKVLEGIVKLDDTYVDTEEIA